MPIYEYRCRKCDKVFEKIQKMNEGGRMFLMLRERRWSTGLSRDRHLRKGFGSAGTMAQAFIVEKD